MCMISLLKAQFWSHQSPIMSFLIVHRKQKRIWMRLMMVVPPKNAFSCNRLFHTKKWRREKVGLVDILGGCEQDFPAQKLSLVSGNRCRRNPWSLLAADGRVGGSHGGQISRSWSPIRQFLASDKDCLVRATRYQLCCCFIGIPK